MSSLQRPSKEIDPQSSKDEAEKNNFTTDIENVSVSSLNSQEDPIFHHDRTRLSQSLKQRHLQMIALVSTIGTGIFLSSGGTLAIGGPLGCFLSYAIVAFIVGCNQMAMAEVASLMPVTGATLRHATHFLDPAMGFAYGWMGVWAYVMPGEISATAVIISYWSDLSQAIWITIIIVVIILLNSVRIRWYGEVEFTFAMIKIILLVGLILVAIVITSGGGPNHEPIGFRYWRDPGPFMEYITTGQLGRFAGFWKALTSVVFSFGGVQNVPNLAAEVKYPRKTIFTACKRVFLRVTLLMVTTSFVLGLIVSPTNPKIANSTGNATSSPFVVAMQNANIKVLPHIVNAGVLTSAFSAANQGAMGCARELFGLAAKGQAPKFFMKTNRWGVPWAANLVAFIFMPLAYMNCSESAANVFNWFQSITSSRLLFTWIIISANHIAMTKAMKVQGIPREKLPHSLRLAPIGAWISLVGSFLLLLTGGFKNFVHDEFLFSNFFSSYFIFPLTFVLFFGWKLWAKTRWIRPHEVDLDSLFRDVDQNPEPEDEPLRGWKILTLLWS